MRDYILVAGLDCQGVDGRLACPWILWTEPLGLAEAQPPPYFRSVTRLRPSPQVELFE